MIWNILILAFILRLIKIDQSLWLDEAISALTIQKYSLIDLVTKFAPGDVHPPGYYIVLWFWGQIFGYSELSLRFPSVILGVLSVWMVFILGKKIVDKNIGLLAAFLLSISPLHIYYSQEVRLYSLITFLVLTSFYFLIQLQKNKYFLAGYILSLVFILYTDYVAYLIIPVQLVYVFIYKKEFFKKLLLALSIVFFSSLPVFLLLVNQLIIGLETAALLPVWANVVGGASLKNIGLIFAKFLIGRISFENKVFYGSIVASATLVYWVLAYLAIKKDRQKGKYLLLFWIVIPVILIFLISLVVPVLSYFRLLFILPAIYLLICLGITKLTKKFSYAIITMLAFISIFSLGIYYATPKFQREDWRSAVHFLQTETINRDLIILENTGVIDPFTYYWKGNTNTIPGLKKIPVMSVDDVVDFNIKDVERIFVIEYLVDITDPDRYLDKKLEELGYIKNETFNFNGVGFIYQYDKKTY